MPVPVALSRRALSELARPLCDERLINHCASARDRLHTPRLHYSRERRDESVEAGSHSNTCVDPGGASADRTVLRGATAPLATRALRPCDCVCDVSMTMIYVIGFWVVR